MKKLRRNRHEATLAGVIAGLGDYFEIDAVALRVFYILIVLVTGIVPGVIAYLLAILVMPAGDGPTVVHDISDRGESH